MKEYTHRQEAAVHWLPASTAVISFCCSTVLAVHICYHPKRKTYHRLLLALSTCDMMASLSMLAARFFHMEEPSKACSNLAALQVVAVGSSVFYNACLAVLFLLMVKFGTKEREIVKYFEIPSHVGCLLGSFILATSAYYLDSLNPVSFSALCWLGSYPEGCHGDDCTHGKDWGFFFHQISHAIFYLVVVILAVSNIVIYCKVRKTLGRNQRYSVEPTRPRRRFSFDKNSSSLQPSVSALNEPKRHLSLDSISTRRTDPVEFSSSPRRRKSMSILRYDKASKSRQVAIRSFLFCGGFVLSYTFAVVVSETERWAKNSPHGTWWFYTFMVLDSIFWPLQGFWDSVIFFRPRYIQWRSACPLKSRFFALHQTLFTMKKPANARGGGTSQFRTSKVERSMIRANDSDDEGEPDFSRDLRRCDTPTCVPV